MTYKHQKTIKVLTEDKSLFTNVVNAISGLILVESQDYINKAEVKITSFTLRTNNVLDFYTLGLNYNNKK